MSRKHPIISVTGSSGAGTTSVMRTFEQIFRRVVVYTAISRAKKACVLFGKRPVLDAFCRRVTLPLRKTFLVEEIRERMNQL